MATDLTATVDEAHALLSDHTNFETVLRRRHQRRTSNRNQTAAPEFDPDQHGPAALARQPDEVNALQRRRQLLAPAAPGISHDTGNAAVDKGLSDATNEQATAATKRLQSVSRRRSQGLQR